MSYSGQVSKWILILWIQASDRIFFTWLLQTQQCCDKDEGETYPESNTKTTVIDIMLQNRPPHTWVLTLYQRRRWLQGNMKKHRSLFKAKPFQAHPLEGPTPCSRGPKSSPQGNSHSCLLLQPPLCKWKLGIVAPFYDFNTPWAELTSP